jgi:hypothetical protein
MADGYDPTAERDRFEVTVDQDLGGGEGRRFYVKTALQEGELVAVSVEAAPGSFLTWDDVVAAESHADMPKAKKRANPSGNGRRRRKA